MKLSPLDIRRHEFKKSVRGYDVMEVDTFREMVADEYEALIKSKVDEKAKIKHLEARLKEFQEIEKTLQSTLMDAQKSLNQSKEDSKKEAEFIIKEAEITSQKILEDSHREAARLKNEIMLLKAQKDSLAIRLKHILNSQIELINILGLDDEEVAEYRGKVRNMTSDFQENAMQAEKVIPKRIRMEEEKKVISIPKEEVKEEEPEEEEDAGQNIIERMVLEMDDEESKESAKSKKTDKRRRSGGND